MHDLKQSYLEQIKIKKNQLDALLIKLNKEAEFREVDCIEASDYKDKKIRYFFEDNLVEEISMVDSDLQVPLFGVKGDIIVAS